MISMLFALLKRPIPDFIAPSVDELFSGNRQYKTDRRGQVDRRSHTRPNVSGLSRRVTIVDRRMASKDR